MRKKYIIPILLLVSACAGNRVDLGLAKPVQIPPLPIELNQKFGALDELDSNATLGEQQLDAIETDRKYNSAATNNNRLIKFYECIRDAVNNKKEFNCL